MRTHLLVLASLALTFLSFVPVASAHACSGTMSDCACPVPSDGKAHSHAGPGGSCTNGASATPGGAQAPGPAFALTLVALVGAVLLARRRAA